MSELTDLFERRGYADVVVSEVLAALEDVLPDARSKTTGLSARDIAFLAQYGGVRRAGGGESARLAARRVASTAAEVALSLDRAEVAERLGISPSRVSHRQADRTLYSLPVGSGKVRYPDWQFDFESTIPHLAEVLSHLPQGAPAAVVRGFMTEPDPDLLLNGVEVSPREWLTQGGEPSIVLELATTLGENPG